MYNDFHVCLLTLEVKVGKAELFAEGKYRYKCNADSHFDRSSCYKKSTIL